VLVVGRLYPQYTGNEIAPFYVVIIRVDSHLTVACSSYHKEWKLRAGYGIEMTSKDQGTGEFIADY
jgi:hypothetical protein